MRTFFHNHCSSLLMQLLSIQPKPNLLGCMEEKQREMVRDPNQERSGLESAVVNRQYGTHNKKSENLMLDVTSSIEKVR